MVIGRQTLRSPAGPLLATHKSLRFDHARSTLNRLPRESKKQTALTTFSHLFYFWYVQSLLTILLLQTFVFTASSYLSRSYTANISPSDQCLVNPDLALQVLVEEVGGELVTLLVILLASLIFEVATS
jgi:hypothetical protein